MCDDPEIGEEYYWENITYPISLDNEIDFTDE